mmetsp:Transcript_22984/g.57098  ORF Transcript_22984/g.57098 Transcript_22984/m.57098 type:complete len:86 (-) Transcript_22984:439-696(-)
MFCGQKMLMRKVKFSCQGLAVCPTMPTDPKPHDNLADSIQAEIAALTAAAINPSTPAPTDTRDMSPEQRVLHTTSKAWTFMERQK